LLPRLEHRIAALAVMALLFAQLGALTHAYAHDIEPWAAAGSPVASPAAHPAGATGHDPCNECLSYAPLLCAAGTPTPLPVIDPQGHGPSARPTSDSLVRIDPALAFRARAPPTAPQT
jgi:hypothetical protein